MKKVTWLVLLFVLVITLTGCKMEKSYDDLRHEFIAHLEGTKSNYIDKINSFNDITCEFYSSIVKIDLLFKHGTGVIFQFDEDYYYILTNAHLINLDNYEDDFKVYDVFDNEYDFEVITYSFSHDLAIIKIVKTVELKVLNFARANSSKNQITVIIGYHGLQKNAITYGKLLLYDVIDFQNENEIDILFPIMVTSNPVKHGSSGSVVLNDEGLLIGLLYAGSFSDNSDVARHAFSLPVERIIEFLGLNDFNPLYKEEE